MSHSPYSHFAVGASLATQCGRVFTGCNVENGAYGLCICAEQVAITKAVSEGYREFASLAVVAEPRATPCGACRQVIGEFFPEDALIHAFAAEDFSNQITWTLRDLLPDRFQFHEHG